MMNLGQMCGNWFLLPMMMCVMMIVFCTLVFKRGSYNHPWKHHSTNNSDKNTMPNAAFDIIKIRYAKGEISKMEYDQFVKDLMES